MFVKICGTTDVEDALLAAGLGASAIGMIFVPSSKRKVTMASASDIVRRLPPEVLTVGVFRNEPKERVIEIVNQLGLRAVQLHGWESPEETRWIGERVPAVIKAFGIDDPALVAEADYGPHRLFIDSPTPGSGEAFDWAKLDARTKGRPYILAGGLNHENVADAIATANPWGVDLATGVEARPGKKDPVKLRKFMVAVREATQNSGQTTGRPASQPAPPRSLFD